MTPRRATSPATAEACPTASTALHSPDDVDDAASLRRRLLIVAAVGLALRFVVTTVTYGTNDAETFRRFGRYVHEHGLVELYQQVRQFNHPPLAGYWAAAAHVASERTGLPFAPIFKIPNLLADLLSAAVLWRVWRERAASPSDQGTGPASTLAATAVAAYAWNLDAILVSAYHGNVDPIYTALCLLAVYLLESRRWSFAAGLAMGAALNVKLLPLVLIPPLVLSFRRAKPLLAFAAGVAVALLPYVPVLLEIPQTFKKNVISYRSFQDFWGISLFLHQLQRFDLPGTYAHDVMERWAVHGRAVVMAAMGLVGLIGRRRGWDRYELCAVALAAFLFLTPGFGLQYTVVLAPFLCARWVRLSLAYGTLTGILLVTAYAWYLRQWYPLTSSHSGGLPPPTVALGLVLWLLIGTFLVSHLRHDRSH